MGNAIIKLSEAKIFIDDTPSISIKELEEKCIIRNSYFIIVQKSIFNRTVKKNNNYCSKKW